MKTVKRFGFIAVMLAVLLIMGCGRSYQTGNAENYTEAANLVLNRTVRPENNRRKVVFLSV